MLPSSPRIPCPSCGRSMDEVEGQHRCLVCQQGATTDPPPLSDGLTTPERTNNKPLMNTATTITPSSKDSEKTKANMISDPGYPPSDIMAAPPAQIIAAPEQESMMTGPTQLPLAPVVYVMVPPHQSLPAEQLQPLPKRECDEQKYWKPYTYAWRADLFGCFDHIIPNCCVAYWLPCITYAQVNSRMGLLSFGWSVVLSLTTWAGITAGIVMWAVKDCYYSEVYDQSTGVFLYSYYVCDYDAVNYIGIVLVWLFFLIFMALLGWQRVVIVRTLVLPGDPCMDVCLATLCPWCSLAQVATQVGSYKEGRCGLGPAPLARRDGFQGGAYETHPTYAPLATPGAVA